MPFMRRSAALSIIVVLGALGFARADVPGYVKASPDAAIKAFGPDIAGKIFSDEFTPLRHEAILRSAKTIPGFECPGDPQVTLSEVNPYPVKPGAVSWIETYTVGCAPRAKRNFLLLLDGERGRIAELLPGSTLTDPALQHDASHSAKVLVKSIQPQDCDKTILVDTLLTVPPDAAGAAWTERWTFDRCTARAEVDMVFTPSPKGGTTWSAKLVR
jgi:hypothetical protein